MRVRIGDIEHTIDTIEAFEALLPAIVSGSTVVVRGATSEDVLGASVMRLASYHSFHVTFEVKSVPSRREKLAER